MGVLFRQNKFSTDKNPKISSAVPYNKIGFNAVAIDVGGIAHCLKIVDCFALIC